jgi:hypothetical protein
VDAGAVGAAPGESMNEEGKSGVVSARNLPIDFFFSFFRFSSRRGGAAT